ncbi:MAG: acetyl-CoA carboxylase biotin carboxyl carrier protein subunit [Planctomycetota bacterium]
MSDTNDIEILLIDGTAYPTRLHRKYRDRKPVPVPDPSEVRSFVPGAVLEVLVEPGQAVTRGQPLLVVEAMKMQNALMAAADGTVADVLVETGTLVEKGDLLVNLNLAD